MALKLDYIAVCEQFSLLLLLYSDVIELGSYDNQTYVLLNDNTNTSGD